MTPQEQWTAVDQYLSDLLLPADPVLNSVLESSAGAGLPSINVSPTQGKLLNLMARMCGAKRILEIGTLGGYSTIWLARALPADGNLITLEAEPKHAKVATDNIARADLSKLVEIRLGPALQTLSQLVDQKSPPFDFIFIDADKPGYPDYLEWSLKLSRPGTVVVADNIIRDGAIIDPNHEDPRVQAVRKFNQMLGSNPRLSATALQTVGSKGYDGFAVALVLK